MNAIELQAAFFKKIKENIPRHKTLVDEVADILNISNDSSYRRIRGDKLLGFDEIEKLSSHFKLSLDSFLQLQNGGLLFSGKNVDSHHFRLENYLQDIITNFSFFVSAEQKEIISLHKDIPIFHHFMFPELAAFKCYFWSRYNLDYAEYNKSQFLIEDYIDIFRSTGTKIYDLYQQIPSTEIWTVDCVNTTIRQIDYYRETRIFKSQRDIEIVFSCLEKLVDHIEHQVELGCKFKPGNQHCESDVKFNLFINDFILGDNTILVQMDNTKMVFINHNVINYMMTSNEEFVSYTHKTLQILLKKSTLISGIGEKERRRFFEAVRDRIHEKRKLL